MSITPIAQVSTDQASGNISFTHGLTLLSGDVLVVFINVNGAGNTVADNNGSTNFTEDDHAANPDSAAAYVLRRVCGASEPSAYAFTLGSSNRSSTSIRQYRGVDSSVWDVAPSASTRSTGSGDTTAEAPACTILTSGACGLVLMADDFLPTTTTYSSINNSYGNVKSESGQQYQVTADKTGLSTGTTGVTTITSSANVSWVAWQVALKPSVSNDVSESESITVSEAKTVAIQTTISESESITVSEAKTVAIQTTVSKSESITVSEAKTVAIQTTVSKSETITLSEAVSVAVGSPQVNESDSITVSEAVSVSVVSAGDINVSASEAITLSETIAAAVSSPQIAESEGITLSEALGVAIQSGVSKTETITLGESVSAAVSAPQISKTETITLSEAKTVAIQTAISKTETVTLGESVSAVVSAPQVSKTETITLSEAVSVSVGAAGVVTISKTDGITVSEAVNVTIAALPALEIYKSETITVTEFDAANFAMNVNVSDAISVTDAGLVDLFTSYSIHAVELITVQDEVGAQVSDAKSRFFRRYVQRHGRGDKQRA